MRPSMLTGFCLVVALVSVISLNNIAEAVSIENETIDTLVPTRISISENGEETIYFAIPCGGSLTGLFASPGRKGLRIAAVARRSEVVCTGMPKFHAISRASAGLKDGVQIVEFSPSHWKSRLTRSNLIEVRQTQPKSGKKLQLVHEASCSKVKGLFIRIEDGSSAEVAVGELTGSSVVDCPYRQEIMPVDFVNLDEFRSISPIVENQGEIEDLYRLRMAHMPLHSLRQLPSGGLALTFLKACNQELVGIAVGGLISRSSQFDPRLAPTAKIGVVLAEFYNRACKPGQPRTSWEVARAPFLKSPGKVLGFEAHEVGDEFVVKSPVSFDSRTAARGMNLSFYGGCNTEFATIYSQSAKTSLMIGVLARRTENLCSSKAALRIMHQPLFSHDSDKGRIYPLRINSL
jgi:hypothetical protein